MIQGINDVGNVLAHITVDIPFTLQQVRSLINQVGCQNLVDNTFLKSLVELVQSTGK